MNELEKNICQLQNMIAVMTQMFLSGKSAEPIKQYPILTQAIELILVGMIREYQSRGIEQHISEIEYWKVQVTRITDAIESGDFFRVIDTLYFEMRENLDEFKKLLSENEKK